MRAFRQRSRRQTAQGKAGNGLPSLDSIRTLMEYEIARARRYERPLSLARVPLDSVFSERRPMRFSDLFAAMPGENVLLMMMPETDQAGAESLARRLQDDGVPADGINVVSFPEDGVTLSDLIDRALETRSARVAAS